MPLTVHILVKNNQKTISKTLTSLLPLDCDVLIGDMGSTDNTLSVCKYHGAKIIELPWENDYSKVKNTLIDASNSDWIMVIEPWESLISGHASIKMLEGAMATCYNVQVMQRKMITKETRVWHRHNNLQFINPVHEHVDVSCSNLLPVIFHSRENPQIEKKIKLIDLWMKDCPTSHKPHYYKACNLLAIAKYDEFLNEANHFLFQENQGKSVVMMKYYLATMFLYVKDDANAALDQILPCLAVRPLMAEFWCLLGDIYYKRKDYKRSNSFYKNALILGSRRMNNDDWPIDLTKYKDHPKQMLESCKSILEETKIISSR